MITMPESYVEYCQRHHGFMTPYTTYNMLDKPKDDSRYYIWSDTNIPGVLKGRMELLWLLKSYPKRHDNRYFYLYAVSKQGIFVEENLHAMTDIPVKFHNIYMKFLHDFGHTCDIITNEPDTRQIVFLYNVQYNEIIDGKHMPNSFDFRSHPDLECKTHELSLKGENHDRPLIIPYDKNVYRALKHGGSYIHLRRDNYLPIEDFEPYNAIY